MRRDIVANTLSAAPRVGGTKDWQSYAYVRAGVDWQLRDELSNARQMFLKALDHDPDNPVALFNLSSCNVRAGEYDLALMRLTKARALADHTDEVDVLRYKAVYQLAATYAYKSASEKDPSTKQRHLADAEREAKWLVEKIERALGSADTSDDVKGVLETIQPIAEILYAGIVAGIPNSPNSGDAEERLSRIEANENLLNLSYRARYNLACYYARKGARAENETNKKAAYRRALQHLEYALERGGPLVQWAREDPALKGLREDSKIKVEDDKTAKDAFAELIKKYGPSDADGTNLLDKLRSIAKLRPWAPPG
jgi:tetratricopeptide (TPR) repeat protein